MDDTLKHWDLRNFTNPVGDIKDLSCFHEESNAIYSPNERYILTGTSSPRNIGTASIKIYDMKTMELVDDIQTPTSCVRLAWHPQLNQLFAGLSDGELRVHFDPELSRGGVMIPLSKGVKKLAVDDYDLVMYHFLLIIGVNVKYREMYLSLNLWWNRRMSLPCLFRNGLEIEMPENLLCHIQLRGLVKTVRLVRI
jgi:hypothetical protein